MDGDHVAAAGGDQGSESDGRGAGRHGDRAPRTSGGAGELREARRDQAFEYYLRTGAAPERGRGVRPAE